MDGKKVLFIILIAVFAGIALYDLGVFKGGQDQGVGTDVRSPRVPQLRLDLLVREKHAYKGVKRDIFTLPSAPGPKIVKVQVQTPDPAPAMEPPLPPPTELQVFASQAHYIGLLDKRAEKTVFINSGSEVLTVKKGDIIGARFKVENITDSELVLKDNSTGEEASITIKK